MISDRYISAGLVGALLLIGSGFFCPVAHLPMVGATLLTKLSFCGAYSIWITCGLIIAAICFLLIFADKWRSRILAGIAFGQSLQIVVSGFLWYREQSEMFSAMGGKAQLSFQLGGGFWTYSLGFLLLFASIVFLWIQKPREKLQ